MGYKSFLILLAFSTQAALAAQLSHLVCLDQLSKTLASAGEISRWDSFPGGTAGAAKGFGEIEVYPSEKSTTLILRTTKTELLYTFKAPGCERSPLGSKPVKEAFTNYDLSQELHRNKSGGFIYIWSPNMVLSVEEVGKLATLNLKVPFTVVLDPAANVDSAGKIQREMKLPPSYLQPMLSSALVDAGLLTHFPGIVFYKNGSIIKLVPGQSGFALKNLVESVLK
jgi:hypothetical protein